MDKIGWVGLTAVLVVLKAFDKIDWSWVWVFAPIWIPLGIVLGFGLGILIVAGIQYWVDQRNLRKKNERKN